jgi:hypothetical protein
MKRSTFFEPRQNKAFKCDDRPLSGTAIATDRAGQGENFGCDACQERAPVSQAVSSRVLACSRFCSPECRNEAELAAEDAKVL